MTSGTCSPPKNKEGRTPHLGGCFRAALQWTEPHQGFSSGDDGLLVRPRRPARHALGLFKTAGCHAFQPQISGSCPPRITSHNSRLTTRRSPVTTSLPTSANRAPPRGPVFPCACPHQMRTGLERAESRLSECYLRCNKLASGRQTGGFVPAFRGSPRQSSDLRRSAIEFPGKFLCLYP